MPPWQREGTYCCTWPFTQSVTTAMVSMANNGMMMIANVHHVLLSVSCHQSRLPTKHRSIHDNQSHLYHIHIGFILIPSSHVMPLDSYVIDVCINVFGTYLLCSVRAMVDNDVTGGPNSSISGVSSTPALIITRSRTGSYSTHANPAIRHNINVSTYAIHITYIHVFTM